MVPNEDELLKGVVEFLPCRELSEEEKREKAEQRRKILEATKTCATVVDGRQEAFTLFFQNIYESNEPKSSHPEKPQEFCGRQAHD